MSLDLDIEWLSQHGPKVSINPRLIHRHVDFAAHWRMHDVAENNLRLGMDVAIAAVSEFSNIISSFEVITISYMPMPASSVQMLCEIVVVDPSSKVKNKVKGEVTFHLKVLDGVDVQGTDHDASNRQEVPLAMLRKLRVSMEQLIRAMNEEQERRVRTLSAFSASIKVPAAD